MSDQSIRMAGCEGELLQLLGVVERSLPDRVDSWSDLQEFSPSSYILLTIFLSFYSCL